MPKQVLIRRNEIAVRFLDLEGAVSGLSSFFPPLQADLIASSYTFLGSASELIVSSTAQLEKFRIAVWNDVGCIVREGTWR